MRNQRLIPYHEVKRVVDQAKVAVAQWQNIDGGYPISPPQDQYRGPSNTWTSAEVGLFVLLSDLDLYHDRLRDLLRYLLNCQHTETSKGSQSPDGGIGFTLDDPSDSNATALSLLLFATYMQFGGELDELQIRAVKSMRDWLLQAMLPEGGMGVYYGKGPARAFNTCFANLALLECLAVPTLYSPLIDSSLRLTLPFIQRTKRRGGWGEAFGQDADAIGTIYVTYILQQLQQAQLLSKEQLDLETGRGGWLLNHQLSTGTWEVTALQHTLEVNAGAVVALLSGGEDPNYYKVQNAVRYLLAHYAPNQGWPPNPGQKPVVWVSCLVIYALSTYMQALPKDTPPPAKKKVFIAHGHSQLRLKVAELVRRLGYQALILQELPTRGTETVIEKLERIVREGVDYVIAIYAEDDRDHPSQNVDYELGLFHNAIGRANVSVIRQGKLPQPSNIAGAIFLDVDKDGVWLAVLEERLTNALERA